MPADRNLLGLQRRFMAALREPIFDESRGRSDLPPRNGAVSAAFVDTAEALIAPSATMEPVERLELYHRQYWYRLLDSIAEDFPGLRLLLGDEAFWRLMEAYLEAVPPRSFTLRHLGASLADFVAAQPALVTHPVHAEEMARLEYALCAVFEAGEQTPVVPAELAEVKLALQPHVKLLAMRTGADVLWRRAENDRPRGILRPPSRAPTRFLVVFRAGLALRVERIPKAAFLILSALDDTGSLELAMGRVTAQRVLRRRDAERVGQWFGAWVGSGWLCHATGAIHSNPTDGSIS